MKTWIIQNPRAGSGRASQAGRELEAAMPDATVHVTDAPGDAERIARLARRQGVELVVPVGGDGTISECVTGLCLEENGQVADAPPALALLPSGTGGDFRRTFGFTNAVGQAISRIQAREPRRIDVGLFSHGNNSRRRAFVNALSFGIGGLTVDLVERGPKWIGGRLTFLTGAFRATLAHQPVPIELEVDGETWQVAPYSNVAICNAQYFGGGMHICPRADPSDGYFDVVTMELSKIETLALTRSIYSGKHLDVPGVRHFQCQRLLARTTRKAPCLAEADGEPSGSLPIGVEILKGALELLC